jgi:hypothetical protein
LVADQHDRNTRFLGDGVDGPGHDWSRCVIAAHRVQRDSHGLLPLGFFEDHDLAILIHTAIRADAVRQNRLVAMRAVLHLYRIAMVVASAFAFAGTRTPSLWDSHGGAPCLKPQYKRKVMLGLS